MNHPTISLLDIPSSSPLEGQEVRVRGFLYRDQEGRYVLAAEPNLRSCCMGHAAKPHLYLQGAFPAPLPVQLVEVQGVLKRGNLEKAQLVSEPAGALSWALGAGLGVVVLFQLYRWKRRRDKLLP